MQLFVVDPSATRRRTLRHPLETALRLPVAEAERGAEALARLKDVREAVVLTGPALGELSAPAFAAALRRLHGHAETPLLLVTPPCSHDEFLAAVDAGYGGCLIVPFDEALLVDKVQRAVEAVRARAAARPRHYRHQGFLSRS